MTFKEFKQWVDLHSDFIKDEDRDKLDNLLKMVYKIGFNNCKHEVVALLNKKYGSTNSSKSSSTKSSGNTGSLSSRFSKRIHDWLGR